MYCTHCGVALSETAKFCSECGYGTPLAGPTAYAQPRRRLVRPMAEKKIAGVCAGVAQYLGVDVTLVRILTLTLLIWPIGFSLIPYIIAWIVMPRDEDVLPRATNPNPVSQPLSS